MCDKAFIIMSNNAPSQQHPSLPQDYSQQARGGRLLPYGVDAGRRYTLSQAPGIQQQQQQQQQVFLHGLEAGGGLMGNHSQRSHGSSSGYRNEISTSPNQNLGGGGGVVFGGVDHALSPTHLAHRMSLGWNPMNAGPTSPGALMDPMDLSGRGLMQPAGIPGGPMSQADREEELLLNLLIARRQRGRVAGDSTKGRSQQQLAEELMRLRQTQASSRSSLPSIPGMPPLFESTASIAPNMYPGMDPTLMQTDLAQQQRQIDMSERIDRSPGRFMDARMSGMGEFSDRSGFKRSMVMPPYEGGSYNYMPTPMEMQALVGPPVKKKRIHKKKPADMPRRPLSAYNLFFSEERERILKEIEGKEKGETEEGEEEKSKEGEKTEDEKPKALLRPMIPSQKKRRPHRKTHGKISFQELARMVGDRWKNLPEEERKYYQDLAKEDMQRQKQAMEEYYAKQNASKEKGSSPTMVDA